jgi:putative membrane protein
MKRLTIVIAIFSLALFLATSCKKESTTTTDTASSTTSTSSTDTSGTTATNATGTSGTTSTGASGGTSGTTSTGASGGTSSPLSEPDKVFVMKAAFGGLAEVKMGELAASNSKNLAVKTFAQRMVLDHSHANDELAQLATAKGLALPSKLDAEHQQTYDKIAKKNGSAFDKAYMDDMVKDHEMDVAEFKKESTAAQDPDLKAWVTKTLPTLEDHLKMAKETQKKVK